MSDAGVEDAWNPGLSSSIPQRLLPQVTVFRPDNACVSHADALEMASFAGMSAVDCACLRVERLALHDVLVRVTADLSVPDGPTYEVLGLNLRAMVATLLDDHVLPSLGEVQQTFDAMRAQAIETLGHELGVARGPVVTDASRVSGKGRTWLSRWFGARTPNPADAGAARTPVQVLAHLEEAAVGCEAPLRRACLQALQQIVGAVLGQQGRLPADQRLMIEMAANRVCMGHGSDVVAQAIAPLFERGVEREGYRRLPAQEKPVIMNVKGASASGKSTIRPQQRALAERLGIPWVDFALISPDYWRKSLLDYASLGEDDKYAAMLTGQELAMIDQKLDRYMAAKAGRGAMSHLLIDRFRFDSFTLDERRPDTSRLLTRFGDRIFLFFMITPPAETVTRAWKRGGTTGRYKAVDDLLYHNVEAYTGMPALFLSWVTACDKRVHFEFLDNDVPEGARPRTAAFGWNDRMTILDVDRMIAIDRYRRTNVDATCAEQVLPDAASTSADDTRFLRTCAQRIARLELADQASGRVYAVVEGGRLRWWDAAFTEALPAASPIRIALEALGHDARQAPAIADPPEHLDVPAERRYTFGRWGGS